MKKTTTRLATIAAVLVMSAFAIILAQHDARKRIRQKEPLALAGGSNEPIEPLAGNLLWPGNNPIVRGNNGRVSETNQFYQPKSIYPTSPPPLAGDTAAGLGREAGLKGDAELKAVGLGGDTELKAEAAWDMAAMAGEITDGNMTEDTTGEMTGGEMTGDTVSAIPNGSDMSGNTALHHPNVELPTREFSQSEFSRGELSRRGKISGQSPPNGNAAVVNSLRGESADRNLMGSSEVVAASGQQPALPAWLPEGNAQQPNSTPLSYPASSLPPPSRPVATLSSPQPAGAGQSQPSGLLPMPSFGHSTTQQQLEPTTSSPIPGTPASPIPGTPTTGPALLDNFATNKSLPGGFESGSQSHASRPQSTFHSLPSVDSARSFETVSRTALVSNQPGSRFLDGSQNPIMQIQKRAPDEIQVGKKATFVITVRNAGNATAHEVTVVDRVPQGARFVESSPTVIPTGDGLLAWTLGEMAAGDERTISLQLIPEVEGEVGSVASVHFAAQASVRTVATLPQVVLHLESVAPVVIGQSQQLAVNIQNTGSGVARGVRLEADIPSQLRHESGETQLEALVGDLRPGESRRLTLTVAAVQAGQSQCVLRAVNDDGLLAEQSVAIDVRAPQLSASISGPSLRYLERQASYQIVVSNTGNSVARNLDFVVHLPVGLKFISADIPQANYNPQSHSVALGLAELEAGQTAPFTINVLPVQSGAQIIRFNGTGDLGIATEAKAHVTVAGLAELSFSIGQDNGTVEVGASTTYAVQISNIGNQPDRNVQLTVQLPEGTKLIQVDAPVEYRVEAGKMVFSPLAEMRHRDVKTFRFQIQHNRAGNQVIRSQLTSENWPVPVVKEEGTLVYNDRN